MRNYDPTITQLPPYFSEEVNIYYDVIPIVDVVNNLTKKITLDNLSAVLSQKGNQAYDESITSVVLTGDLIKTIVFNRRNAAALNLSYVDTHVHYQTISEIEWTVIHNMNKFPSVTIVDSAGSIVEGAVDYINLNSCKITFCGAFSGKAYFN
jgi:hypothetical protein